MRLFNAFFVSLLLVISAFASCKSTKSISDFSEKSQVHIRSADSLALAAQIKEEQHQLMNEMISEGWDIDYTIYLPPDQNGQQNIKSTVKIKKQRNVKRSEQRLHNKDETQKMTKKKRVMKSKDREIVDKKEDSKSAEHHTFPLSDFINFAIGFALIIFLYRWLH